MASFTKLKDGSWGVRGASPAPVPGALVDVYKADGSHTTATVAAIVAKFPDGNWIASLAPKGVSASPVCKVSGGKCRASGCSARALVSGYCKGCEFDEFDN